MRTLKIVVTVLLLAVAASAFASPSHSPALLEVFADSVLSEALAQIKSDYEAHHQVSLNLMLASSEELAGSIAEGTACDVFIASSPKYLDKANVISSTKTNIAFKVQS